MNDAHDYDDEITTGPEFERFWCAVINQALNDALDPAFDGDLRPRRPRRSRPNPAPRNVSKARLAEIQGARNWFRLGDRDFQHVCGLAGLEPEVVRKGALEAINKHVQAVEKRRSAGRKEQQATL